MRKPKNLRPFVELNPAIFVRELDGQRAMAWPVAEPGRVAFGSLEGAPEEVRLFLTQFLEERPADELAGYALPAGASLVELPVLLPRPELPERVRIKTSIGVPCVVLPSGKGAWVVAVPLQHTFWVPVLDDVPKIAAEEIARMVGARELSAAEYLRLLPGRAHRVVSLGIEVDRLERQGEAALGDERSKRAATKKTIEAARLLAEIGTPLAERLDGRPPQPLVARKREFATLRGLLCGKKRHGVVVVGESLVGKSRLIEAALASQKRVYVTSGAQLIAGQSFFGQWQERLHKVMRAAEVLDAVLWFDDLADLFAGRDGDEDMAGIVRPYVDGGRVRLVGELRPDQVQTVESRHVGLYGALHPVRVEPFDVASTRTLLSERIEHLAKVERDRPNLRPEIIEPLLELSQRYLPYEHLPGKVVRLTEELRSIQERPHSGLAPTPVGLTQLFAAFTRLTGIPDFLLRTDRALKLERVQDALRKRVIGQDAAVRRVAEVVCTVKAELQPAGKPLATFLFVGPTGVGKTEVAKTLAHFLFGSAERLVRFDMSEYMDPWAAERLIRGTDTDDGLLTRQIRRQPFAVVLLDEIEKAHSAVFDLLLQVTGEGRLTDARGKTAYFHNAIIILTSNLGAGARKAPIGMVDAAHHTSGAYYTEQVEKHFRPELVNRLDRIVAFETLTEAEIQSVARVALAGIRERHGLAERGISLEVDADALTHLATAGYSKDMGARALQRHLDRALVAPISALLAEGGDLQQAQAHASLVNGQIKVTLRRGRARDATRELGATLRIGQARALVTDYLAFDRIELIRERAQYLVTELSTLSTDASTLFGQLASEHHRLAAHLTALDGAMGSLEELEELAVTALLDGEAPDSFGDHVADTMDDVRRALAGALVAQEPERNAITLHLSSQEHPKALRLWLEGLLSQRTRLGWQVVAHLAGDKGKDWPGTRAFGPPLGPDELTHRLATFHPTQALVCVSGENAAGWLALEAGIHRFQNVGLQKQPRAHLVASVLQFEHTIDKKQWGEDLFKRRDPVSATVLRASTPARWLDHDADTVKVHDKRKTVPVTTKQYWKQFEQVVFWALLPYELNGSGTDRALAVYSCEAQKLREARAHAEANSDEDAA